MRTIQRTIVSALIFSIENKLLMGKKDPKKGGVYFDCWHIPGGGIEENESKVDALIREINEEVGLDISNDKIQLVSDDGKGTSEKILKDTNEKVLVEMQFFVYKVSIQESFNNIKVKLNDDLVECGWFDLKELTDMKLTPPSVTLFQKLGYIK